jgi:hypothetical protein
VELTDGRCGVSGKRIVSASCVDVAYAKAVAAVCADVMPEVARAVERGVEFVSGPGWATRSPATKPITRGSTTSAPAGHAAASNDHDGVAVVLEDLFA